MATKTKHQTAPKGGKLVIPSGVVKPQVIQSGADGPYVERVKVTPELAAAYLTRNTANRAVRDGHVARLAADITEGHWRLNGDTIKLGQDGALLDGQHRLWAVVMADKPIEAFIAYNVPEAAMLTIDTGAARTFANVLQIRGETHTAILAAVLRWQYWYDVLDADEVLHSQGVSHARLNEMLKQHPGIAEAVKLVSNKNSSRRLSSTTFPAFVYYNAKQIDEQKAYAWLDYFLTGTNMDKYHPVLRLRDRLIANRNRNHRILAVDMMAYFIKSWVFFNNDRPMKQMGYKAAVEKFPRFTDGVETKMVKA